MAGWLVPLEKQEVAVSITDYVATLAVSSGVAVPIQFCVKKGEEYTKLPIELNLKELTVVRSGDMENQLKMEMGTYTVSVDGPYVSAGDMLRFVSAGSSCSEPSPLTFAVQNDKTTTVTIDASVTESAFEACYKFAGETEYVKYASKTLQLFVVSGVTPSKFVANVATTTVFQGVGFAVGDKVWFTRESCDAAPADAVTITDLTSVVLTVTDAAVTRMCYEFVNYKVVMVPTPIVVYTVTSVSHAKWLTTIPIPTSGFAVEGKPDTTPMTIVGSNFSPETRVKFVQNSEECTGVSTNPIQVLMVTNAGTEAQLMPVVFTVPGTYYLCIVHDPMASVYTHYPITVTVEATAIEGEVNDAKMFVLSEEPISDTETVTAEFLDFVTGEVSAVWTETVCDNYVLEASLTTGADKTVRTVSSQFTRAYSSLHLCLRLPGDYYVASRIRKVFKVFTVLESPTPFVSSTVHAIPFTLQGQNLKVDDKVAFVQSPSCAGVSSGITVNSGSVSVDLVEGVYDFYVCYQFSEFGASSAYHIIPAGSEYFKVTVYRLKAMSFTTLVQQTVTVELEGGKTLPDGVTVRVISAAGSCTSLAAGVDAVSANSQIEVTPSNDVVFDAENQVCMRMTENSPFFGFKQDVVMRFARIIPLEDPLFLLTGVGALHTFSLQASAEDQFAFVAPEASCTGALSTVSFSLVESAANFTISSGFLGRKLCYNFVDSAGFFAFEDFKTFVLPESGDKFVASEVRTVYAELSSTARIATYLLDAVAREKTEKDTILDASSALVQEDVSYSAKVMAVLYGMNYDIDGFAKKVVKEMNATMVPAFVGSYASQVSAAYSSGNSENPQKLLLQLLAEVNGDPEKMEKVLEGWRSTADKGEADVDGSSSADISFSDGSSVSFETSSSRRLADSATKKVTVNKYQCYMVDVDITEGFCYEVLIDGSTANKLDKEVRFKYDKRDKDDTHCASKADIMAVGWNEREADNNNDCSFESGRAVLTGSTFGVVTTHQPSGAQPTKINPKALSVILIMSIVIFVLLFIGLGYTLWVYVHPMEPEEVNSMWDSFEEDRRKNLEQRRAERAERKKKLIEMEEQAALSDDDDYSDSSYSDSDSGSDNGGNGDLANSMYDDLMARPEETDDDGDYNTAIRSANDSSMFAQQAAENTDIVPDTNMERDADMGEVRRE